MNPAFLIGQQVGANFDKSFREQSDISALDKILRESVKSKDPNFLQSNIQQILQKVSPERQKQAIEFINNRIESIASGKERQAKEELGINPYLPNQIAAEQYKQGQKSNRLNAVGLGVQGGSNRTAPQAVVNQQLGVSPQPGTAPQTGIPQYSKEELTRLLAHPDIEVREFAKGQLKNLANEEKEDRADIRAAKQERAPVISNIIQRADRARESILNKTHLIDIINRGNIDDPTLAVFLEALPLNIGKRLLSNDTIEYKSGLVDEFRDLKNIFQGATRVKEVELYENKLADLYLTDDQKKAILKTRINMSKADIIIEEAAAEVEQEFPNLSALQFSKKVQEKAKDKMNNLFNEVWSEQKATIDQAELIKKRSLNKNDPDDLQIIKQILKETNNDYKKAEELARKKGYKF